MIELEDDHGLFVVIFLLVLDITSSGGSSQTKLWDQCSAPKS